MRVSSSLIQVSCQNWHMISRLMRTRRQTAIERKSCRLTESLTHYFFIFIFFYLTFFFPSSISLAVSLAATWCQTQFSQEWKQQKTTPPHNTASLLMSLQFSTSNLESWALLRLSVTVSQFHPGITVKAVLMRKDWIIHSPRELAGFQNLLLLSSLHSSPHLTSVLLFSILPLHFCPFLVCLLFCHVHLFPWFPSRAFLSSPRLSFSLFSFPLLSLFSLLSFLISYFSILTSLLFFSSLLLIVLCFSLLLRSLLFPSQHTLTHTHSH